MLTAQSRCIASLIARMPTAGSTTGEADPWCVHRGDVAGCGAFFSSSVDFGVADLIRRLSGACVCAD